MKYKLKKCPFCGNKARIIDGVYYKGFLYAVKCGTCGARTDYSGTKKSAQNKWNRRTEAAAANE